MSATRSLFDEPVDDFRADPQRREPVLWVERIVIVERPQPDLVPIRDVELRRGLNIIATARPKGADGPVGHNVGKTLFTRLIRYCLGETHFARERVRQAIAEVLPDAYVVAVVHVQGKPWVVARPIGALATGDSWCVPGDRWQAVLEDPTHALKYNQFLETMHAATVATFSKTPLPHEQRPVRWQDLLAWLSRDQYCRYRDPLEWRTPATESGTKNLNDEDSSILLRLVMDLVEEPEVRLIHQHKRLLSQRTKQATVVADLEGDLKQTRRFLEDRLKLDGGLLDADLFAAEAKGRALQRQRRLKQRLDELETTSGLDVRRGELNDANNNVTKLQQQIDTRESDRQITEGELQTAEAASQQQLVEYLGDLAHPCTLPVGRCPLKGPGPEVPERNPIRELIVSQKTAELQSLDQTLAELRQQLKTAHQRAKRAERRFQRLEVQVKQRRRSLAAKLSTVDAALAEAKAYGTAVATLTTAQEKLGTMDRRIEQSRETQRAARDQIAQKRRVLDGHFHHVLHWLLGADYSGRFDISMKGINLILDEHESVPGEAMATSGTVHALDLACLRASVGGLGTMPRFLIHDSPREGDLEAHLYARLFSWAVGLEAACRGGEPPFQYIVATTTPPPREMMKLPYLRLTLDARDPRGLLLRRRF